MRTLVSAIAASLALACAAAAQTAPDKLTPAQREAIRDIVRPTGVGGCLFYAVKPELRVRVIGTVIASGPVTDLLRGPVAELAPRCTGRPFSNSDVKTVGAVMSAFMRQGYGFYIADRLALGQHRLNAAWDSASAADKAPFIASADVFLASTPNVSKTTPDQLLPFLRALNVDPASTDRTTLGMIQGYYLAVSLGERAEAALAADGARPTGS